MSRARKKMQKIRSLAAPASLETELREEVKRVIQEAPASAYPALASRLTDVEGYQQVEEAIIQYVLHNQVTPGAALAQLDSEWGGI